MVNKKTVWSVTNIGLRLLVICLAVAALTALVYAVTVGPIADGERARKEDAIRLIFTDADDFTEDADIVGEGVNAVYAVTDAEGVALGWCVDYTGNSDYGGAVNMMIGIGTDGKVNGVQVISHAETFIDRYLDDENRYTGIDQPHGADLSAGATLSYNAIRDAITAVEKLFEDVVVAEAPLTETVLFSADDVKLLFADAADFSGREEVNNRRVGGVCLVKNAAGETLGRCVHYTAPGGYGGNMTLLLGVSEAGEVTGVLVLKHSEDFICEYLDEKNCYNGVDQVAGATRSYQAIRNAITDIEALQWGGAL